jgi:hypothetical protein
MPNATDSRIDASRASERFMWITPDRLLYVGLLGAPSSR